MQVLTPSGEHVSRHTPTVAAEQKAMKAAAEAISEYGPLAKAGFPVGTMGLPGVGAAPGGARMPGTSWSNQGNATMNALVARASQNLQSSFQRPSPEVEAYLAEQGLSWGPPFPPGRPLDPFWGYRRPARTWDFQVGENVQLTPRWNRVSFKTLKALYEAWDVPQICVRHHIDDVRSLDVSWLPPKNCQEDVSQDIEAAEAFWAYPDKEQPLDCWLAEWLQDVLRWDAGALNVRETEAGDPYSIEVVSGETIIPLIDYFGRRPRDGEADDQELPEGKITPAYLQIIMGMPWNWLTAQQMVYQPLWPLPESQYGQCPLETILLTGSTDVRFQWHFLQFFTEGSLPAGFMEAPPDLSDPAQVTAWQDEWDSLMIGDQAKLRQIRWVPSGAKFQPAKEAADKFDETFPLYLMRRCAAAYKVTPADLGYTEDVNKASSEIQVDVQARVGRRPITQFVEGVINLVTSQRLKLRARIHIDDGKAEDRLEIAQAHSVYIEKGVESPDEVRAELGKPINKETPFPRFIDNARSGPIPELAIASQAGKIDPETYGRDASQELVSTPYASPPGALPPQGSPEQKAAAQTTAQAARDLIAATTGTPPPTAEPAEGEPEPPGEGEAGKALGWREVLAVLDVIEKGETAGITAATGIQGRDLRGAADDDDDEDEVAKAAEVALEIRRWRRNARMRLKKGRNPAGPFATAALPYETQQQVRGALKDATTPEEVDAVFAGLGKPSAGERPAFHSQADRLVAHYSPLVRTALQGLFSGQQIHDAIAAAEAALPALSLAEKAAVWDRSLEECTLRQRAYYEACGGASVLKDAQLDLAFQAARQALESGEANTGDLRTVLDALYGDSLLQGAHDAALATGGTVVASLKDVEASVPSSYWSEWKPGYGQAAASAADGGMRAMLDEAGIRIQGITDTLTDDIGNTISRGLSQGDSIETVAKAVTDQIGPVPRAEAIANTEYARAMTTASVETYEANAVAHVNWLAEADACPECEANADGSPYPTGEAPTPPEHPNCRCALAPAV